MIRKAFGWLIILCVIGLFLLFYGTVYGWTPTLIGLAAVSVLGALVWVGVTLIVE